jgi:hypothetical protein
VVDRDLGEVARIERAALQALEDVSEPDRDPSAFRRELSQDLLALSDDFLRGVYYGVRPLDVPAAERVHRLVEALRGRRVEPTELRDDRRRRRFFPEHGHHLRDPDRVVGDPLENPGREDVGGTFR